MTIRVTGAFVGLVPLPGLRQILRGRAGAASANTPTRSRLPPPSTFFKSFYLLLFLLLLIIILPVSFLRIDYFHYFSSILALYYE